MGRNYYSQKYPDRICEVCGKVFSPKQWNSKYCSPECKQENHNQNYKLQRINAVYKITCKTCGKSFKTSHQNKIYCSDECRKRKKKKLVKERKQTRFVFIKSFCPNPDCNWRLDCGGNKSACLRAKCNNGVAFT